MEGLGGSSRVLEGFGWSGGFGRVLEGLGGSCRVREGPVESWRVLEGSEDLGGSSRVLEGLEDMGGSWRVQECPGGS